MAEDFTDPFRYGLNNLPPEPPDNFGHLYSANGSGVLGTPPFGGPQVVQAGYRLPFFRGDFHPAHCLCLTNQPRPFEFPVYQTGGKQRWRPSRPHYCFTLGPRSDLPGPKTLLNARNNGGKPVRTASKSFQNAIPSEA
jgi:hypothetical protein